VVRAVRSIFRRESVCRQSDPDGSVMAGRGYGIEHVPVLRRGARRGRPRVLLSAQAVAPPRPAGRNLNIPYLGGRRRGARCRCWENPRSLPTLPPRGVLSGIRGTPPETPGKEGSALPALSHGQPNAAAEAGKDHLRSFGSYFGHGEVPDRECRAV